MRGHPVKRLIGQIKSIKTTLGVISESRLTPWKSVVDDYQALKP